MEHQEIYIIQSLVDNPKFRDMVRQLAPGENIPEKFASEFKDYTAKDMRVAREIVLSLESDKHLSNNKDQIWTNIVKAADAFDRTNKNPDQQGMFLVRRRPSKWKSAMKYVAIFAGILVAAVSVLLLDETQPPTEIQTRTIVKSNPSGQKSRIHLEDGSVVHLNAESELQYVEGFTKDDRTIYLKGEAYFEVAKDVSRPFAVISNNIRITALGTEFNVNAFEQDVQVALLEGSVAVSNTNNRDEVILDPMKVVRFDSYSEKFHMENANADNLVLWKNRIICFDNTPVDEAIKVLSRWYAVNIDIGHAPARELTCSGKFNNQSLELVLKNLGYTLDFKYKIQGKNVTLNFKN